MPKQFINKYSPITRRKNGFAPEIHTPPLDDSRVVSDGVIKPVPPSPSELPADTRPILWIVASILLLAFFAQYIIPQTQPTVAVGTSLQGHAMDGLTRDMLDARVPELYADFLKNPVTLVYRDRTWQPTSAELGISLDIRQTNNALLGLTFDTRRGVYDWVRTLYARWQGDLDIGPTLIVNGPKLQAYLMNVASEIDVPARPTGISIDPQSSRSQILAAEDGRQLLVDETALDIIRVIDAAQPSTVSIRTRVITPTSNEQSILQNAADAERFLSAPIEIRFGDQRWTWTKDEILYLFNIEQRSDGVLTTPNEGAIALEVERLAKRIDRPSKEPRIRLVDGVPTLLAEGVPGIQIDQAAAVVAIRNAFYAESRTVELPSISIAPKLTLEAIQQLRFDDILSTGRSSFAGSADYRITNIKAGARILNGTLIAPNSEFSFNTHIGEIDEANGFMLGAAIVNNRTQQEPGGGICQVSTSVFRAAFYAGLPITEWHHHQFYISWYDAYAYPDRNGPGLDAAIFTGQDDLRFRNDTNHWMMMDITVDETNQILDIQLRGVATGRTVQVSEPNTTKTDSAPSEPRYIDDPTLPVGTVKQTDKARDGMDVVVYRTVLEDGKVISTKDFATSFAAWPDIYLRGTGEQTSLPHTP